MEATLKAATHLQQVRAAEQLKAELLLKQEFLSNVSHEMRSRLHLILGYGDLLLAERGNEGLPHSARQSLETIQRHSRALWGLANNFLNFVKLDAEAMRVCPRPFLLAEIQKEFQESMEFLLQRKPVSFVWEMDPQLSLVWADRDKLCIILQNLLGNAAKFTSCGEIRLRAVASPADNGVCIHVTDTGVGIAPAYHEAIFNTFQQVPNPASISGNSVEDAGIGIGLTLARKLARMMGGDITVASVTGAGATFTLFLRTPATEVRESEVPSSAPAPSSTRNALDVPSSLRAQPGLAL